MDGLAIEGSDAMAAKNGVRIPPRDQLWLLLDRPDNLMYINSVVWFAQVPDWDALTRVLDENVAGVYPVFRSVPQRRGRRWYWVEHPGFDIGHHITRSRLPEPGDQESAEAHISARMSVPLPGGRPLWSVEYIENFHGEGFGEEGALLLFRVQHGVVDGVRLTQLILSMCELDDEDGAPPAVGRSLGPPGGILQTVSEVGGVMARDSFGIARGLTGAAMTFPLSLAKLVRDVTAPGFGLTRVPTRVVESLASTVSPTNTVANTYRSIFRLLWEPRTASRSWTGRARAEKKVSWVTGIDLAAVKRVARAHDTTVTTVMIAAVSRALTEYLRSQGDKPLADINLMVPMSVAPVGDGPPTDLGNHITLILLRLPLGVDDPQTLIDEITESMVRVQYSFEPHVTYAAMVTAAAAVPVGVTNALVDVVANKAIGQLTSVPGPTSMVRIAGTPVAGLLGWVPMTGDQSLGICIYSYNGQVTVGIATDAGLVPEPGVVAGMIERQFTHFAGWDADRDD